MESQHKLLIVKQRSVILYYENINELVYFVAYLIISYLLQARSPDFYKLNSMKDIHLKRERRE